MSGAAQKRALQKYRTRLTELGMARFEVLGLDADRDLIRSLAKRLTEEGPEAAKIQTTLRTNLHGEAPPKGRILAALRRSPLMGSDLDSARARVGGRRLDL
ncbi:MAG TPA: hypothetical protein VFL86_07130 [Burkholderiaceae bacterium]|nr:hypothetical protein [Burkholderiaceae bacterium]